MVTQAVMNTSGCEDVLSDSQVLHIALTILKTFFKENKDQERYEDFVRVLARLVRDLDKKGSIDYQEPPQIATLHTFKRWIFQQATNTKYNEEAHRAKSVSFYPPGYNHKGALPTTTVKGSAHHTSCDSTDDISLAAFRRGNFRNRNSNKNSDQYKSGSSFNRNSANNPYGPSAATPGHYDNPARESFNRSRPLNGATDADHRSVNRSVKGQGGVILLRQITALASS